MAAATVPNYYYIKSEANSQQLEYDDTPDDWTVYARPRKSNYVNQKWRDDPDTGTIRTRVNDFCMELDDGKVIVKAFAPGRVSQQWARSGKFIVSKVTNMVLQIEGKTSGELVTQGTLNDKCGCKTQSWEFPPASAN